MLKRIIKIIFYSFPILTFFMIVMRSNKLYFGYENIWILPLFYSLVSIFIYFPMLKKVKYPITTLGVILTEYLRCVILPLFISFSDLDPGMPYINPEPSNINISIILMCYELIVISIFLFFITEKTSYKKYSFDSLKSNRLTLKGNRLIYFIISVVAFLLLVTVGIPQNLINFLYIKIDQVGVRNGDEENTNFILIRQFIQIGLFLTFLLSVSYFKEKYKKDMRKINFLIPVFFAFLNIAIIIGERRTNQIYISFLCALILVLSYPSLRRKIITYISLFAGTILIFMSIYKFSYAFIYGSYGEAINNSNYSFNEISKLLQIYFFGPENIAAILELKRNVQISFDNLIFDIGRSTFGISFLLKSSDYTLTSEIFNTFIYGESRANGQVISSIGYSLIYFGFLFTPLFTIINVWFSLFIEKNLYKSESYESIYLLGYILIRMSTNLFVSSIPLISFISMTLGTVGLVLITSQILSIKRRV